MQSKPSCAIEIFFSHNINVYMYLVSQNIVMLIQNYVFTEEFIPECELLYVFTEEFIPERELLYHILKWQ